ncbi:hypothetical protein T484DRAFT_1756691, partial [Baffinella frigidus]
PLGQEGLSPRKNRLLITANPKDLKRNSTPHTITYHELHDVRPPALPKPRPGTNLQIAEAARQRPPPRHGRLAPLFGSSWGDDEENRSPRASSSLQSSPLADCQPSLPSPALSPQSFRAPTPKHITSRTVPSSAPPVREMLARRQRAEAHLKMPKGL